jgi:hypothetical protein
MKGTLVILVMALLALAAIAIAAEPITPTVRQLATSSSDEPLTMVLSGAALLIFAGALRRAG